MQGSKNDRFTRFPSNMNISIIKGLPREHTLAAAALYFDALREKLDPVFGPRDTAVSFLSKSLDETKCRVALNQGELVGILGIQDGNGGFIDPSFPEMIRTFGLLSGICRIVLLMLLDHKIENGELYLDGIAVADSMRKKGIGTRLISEFESLAKTNGHDRVTLEVIDTNPKARALYRRLGYKRVKTHSVWPFTRVFGFKSVEFMAKKIG